MGVRTYCSSQKASGVVRAGRVVVLKRGVADGVEKGMGGPRHDFFLQTVNVT